MLNLNKIGKPIAKIVGGKYNGHIVSVTDTIGDQNEENGKSLIQEFKQLKIANDAYFQPIPSNAERDIAYVTGASGSGKTWWTRKFLEEYKKKYKQNEVYVFSSLHEDSSLDSIKPKRIMLDERMHEDPLDVQIFQDSICVFDDIDVITDKKIKDAVYNLLNQILEIGRHYKVSCICTAHLPTNGRESRRILNESALYVYFPHSAGNKIRYLLEHYIGVDKK